MQESNFPNSDTPELDEAQSLASYVGKVGYIQLGFAYQGVVILHESTTSWYERYQNLLESLDGLGDIVFGDDDADEDAN